MKIHINNNNTEDVVKDFDCASKMIAKLLSSDKPCMICRYGANELNCMMNYISIKNSKHSIYKYIKGEEYQWWVDESNRRLMKNNAGFFSTGNDSFEKFSQLMINESSQIDILASWTQKENIPIIGNRKITKIGLLQLEPYWSNVPWSKELEGKNVLVIHPFSELIEEQYYNHRSELFENKNVLPEFNLITIKAVQSICGNDSGFKDWFCALKWMQDEMDSKEYDVALIGCGAYGFPLAAHAKRTGHKAVHLGGALQLLFGIRGRRWDNPKYGSKTFLQNEIYKKMFNSSWVYPDERYKTANSESVECGCYWK